MDAPPKKPKGWVSRGVLERMLPSNANEELCTEVLEKLIGNYKNENTLVICLGTKDGKDFYCFSPKFVMMWDREIEQKIAPTLQPDLIYTIRGRCYRTEPRPRLDELDRSPSDDERWWT